MVRAVCISCGNSKASPWKNCRACGFDPMGDEMALVKSVYLSEGRYECDDDKTRYRQELEKLSSEIQNGRQIQYDPEELKRLLDQKQLVESVRRRDLLAVLFRTFLPTIVLIGILVAAGLLLRWLRG